MTNVETPKPAVQREMVVKGEEGRQRFMVVLCEPEIGDLRRVLNYLSSSTKPENLATCELVVIGGLDYTSVHQTI